LGGGIDVRILQRYPRVGDISLSKKKRRKKLFQRDATRIYTTKYALQPTMNLNADLNRISTEV
jgi:hypothetical protein